MLQWFKQFTDLQEKVKQIDGSKASADAVMHVYETLAARALTLEQQVAELSAYVKACDQQIQGLEIQIKNLEDKPQGLLVDEREIARNSGEPWANINFLEFDPVKGFRFEGDWNDEFIEHLKLAGFTGNTDEEIFQRYMARIALSISEKFEAQQKVTDEAKGKQSKFE